MNDTQQTHQGDMNVRAAQGALSAANAATGAERLGRLADARFVIEDETRRTVAEMRSAGTTWQAIGDALSTTRSAAQQRYGR